MKLVDKVKGAAGEGGGIRSGFGIATIFSRNNLISCDISEISSGERWRRDEYVGIVNSFASPVGVGAGEEITGGSFFTAAVLCDFLFPSEFWGRGGGAASPAGDTDSATGVDDGLEGREVEDSWAVVGVDDGEGFTEELWEGAGGGGAGAPFFCLVCCDFFDGAWAFAGAGTGCFAFVAGREDAEGAAAADAVALEDTVGVGEDDFSTFCEDDWSVCAGKEDAFPAFPFASFG